MRRVALLSVHTCPLAQPGSGWAGGMNVYVNELARVLARNGVEVDVFTRRHSSHPSGAVEVKPGFTLHHVEAGPPRELAPEVALGHLGAFTDRVIDRLESLPGDGLIHSHYWLSGWSGLRVAAALGLPHVHSFHTLGRVKDRDRRLDSPAVGTSRLAAEDEVIAGSARIIASTTSEKSDLVDHYGADPDQICVAPPGIDHDLFTPGPVGPARRRLGWPDIPTVLFVGRIQALKGPDVALGAFAELAGSVPDSRMVMVGAPSGDDGPAEMESLERLVKERDLVHRVTFAEPVPHRLMSDVYRASSVVVVPSRSESFGLVAAEAQASGIPVVAADAGGLAHVVPVGSGGLAVSGWDPVDWAARVESVLTDGALARKLSLAGPAHARSFSWDAAVRRIVEIYRDVA